MTSILDPELDFQPDLDAEGNAFDPEIHSPGPHGTGVLTKKGLWRKKMGRAAHGGGQVGPTPAMPHRKVSSKGVDYRPGLYGIAQLSAAALVAFSPLDAAAITTHSPPLIEAIQVTAENEPGFASLLDKILSFGPWGLLVSASLPLIVQILHNHEVIPANIATTVGAKSREALLVELGLGERREHANPN